MKKLAGYLIVKLQKGMLFQIMAMFLLLSIAFPILAIEEMPVPPKIQVVLLTKILTFDKSLKERAGDTVKIAILTTQEDESKKVGKEIEKVIEALPQKKIQDSQIAYKVIEYKSEEELTAMLESEKVSVLYVAPGNESNIKKITDITRDQKVLTMTGIPKYVELGVSVGIGIQNKKPQIQVNLSAAKAEGVNFSAQLLKMAKIVKKD